MILNMEATNHLAITKPNKGDTKCGATKSQTIKLAGLIVSGLLPADILASRKGAKIDMPVPGVGIIKDLVRIRITKRLRQHTLGSCIGAG